MRELRYNRVFRNGLIAILFSVLLFSFSTVVTVISKLQYEELVSDMLPAQATIVDIDTRYHTKGNVQRIFIEYFVDGVSYERELKTDTGLSLAPGIGSSYSVGEKLNIFYDPENPAVIASPQSVQRANVFLVLFSVFTAFSLVLLMICIKTRRRFLVTPEEYKKEGEELKRKRMHKRR